MVEFTSPTTTMQSGPAVVEDRLEPLHDAGRLGGVRARADVEVDVGVGDVERAEEVAGQRPVVVLARVDEGHVESGAGAERARDGADLHEVRPGPGDEHHLLHHRSSYRLLAARAQVQTGSASSTRHRGVAFSAR